MLIVYGNNAMLLRKNAWDNKLLIGQAHNYTDKYKARIKVSMSEVKSCKYLEKYTYMYIYTVCVGQTGGS